VVNKTPTKKTIVSIAHSDSDLGKPPEYTRAQLDLVKDMWAFLSVRKKFWLLPIMIIMILFGALLVLAQSSAVAPFIYTLF